ncbi:hypothetical protein [Terriglobus saanensis]|uniref:Uncharacterized protein n=1 Tax=Terriglobus saanensis (strain ATCC BAA-1853 / DSM 23119 / SP1PR4) TaxID=401053 RepID=E8V863_TERSS|nr:hypothetical protein [Terriglobus saanensis]ADV84045.1 hypothetical protein AciPR4_3290 [Terriglobus saanensis SP1PR4]
MQSPDTLRAWLADQALPFGLLLAFLAAGLIVVFVSGLMRKSRLASRRAGRDEASFVNEMLPLGYDLRICRTAYAYLQKDQQISFPILPEDRLSQDLGLEDTDVTDLVNHLLAVNSRERKPGMLNTPLITVQDVLRQVQASPMRRLLVA